MDAPYCQALFRDDKEVKIAPVHSDFRCESSSLSLMGFCWSAPQSLTRTQGASSGPGLCQPRSNLSCHHYKIA